MHVCWNISTVEIYLSCSCSSSGLITLASCNPKFHRISWSNLSTLYIVTQLLLKSFLFLENQYYYRKGTTTSHLFFISLSWSGCFSSSVEPAHIFSRTNMTRCLKINLYAFFVNFTHFFWIMNFTQINDHDRLFQKALKRLAVIKLPPATYLPDKCRAVGSPCLPLTSTLR